MDYERLLEHLDIESPEDLQYFENVADLIECDEHIESDAMEKLLAGADGMILSELIENYFSELLDKMPEKSVDIYTLISTISRSLSGLARSISNEDEKSNISVLAEEISKFRQWYMFDKNTVCRNIKTGEEKNVPVSEAILLYRMESLSDDEYDYDFTECLDYEIEEYVMSFSSLMENEYEEYSEFDE